MADPRFFKNHGPFTVRTLAEKVGADASLHVMQDLEVRDVAALDQADEEHLSFLDNIKYKGQFLETQAGVCLVSPMIAEQAPRKDHLLVHPNPYKAYAMAAQMFYPQIIPPSRISERAYVHPDAVIGKGCVIEDGAVVEQGVKLGEQCLIESGAVVKENCCLGKQSRIGANAVVSHSVFGDYVRIYPGAMIGQDGFGFAIDPAGHVKVPQLGRVVIEDHVEVGANTTIDRGAGPDTVVGQGTWIDNLVQIGHNVKIGKGCIIVAQVGISGSTVIGDYVAIGGQAGIAGHLHVGQGARLSAQAGVMRNVPAGEEQMGAPAVPAKQFMRQVAMLKRLAENKK